MAQKKPETEIKTSIQSFMDEAEELYKVTLPQNALEISSLLKQWEQNGAFGVPMEPQKL